MFRKLTPLFGALALCCGQSAVAEDQNYLNFDIKDGSYIVNLGSFYNTPSCRNQPSSGSLFGATICVLTPGVEDEFFDEDRRDLGVYNTNKAEDLLDQFEQEELERRYGKDGSKLKEDYCKSKHVTNYNECEKLVKGLYDKETSTGVFRLNFRGLKIFAAFPYPVEKKRKRRN